jgi:hypothetical protein
MIAGNPKRFELGQIFPDLSTRIIMDPDSGKRRHHARHQ